MAADDRTLSPTTSGGPRASTNATVQEQDEAQGNRGRRAPRDGSGPVTGSGAGAGGGGNPEEYDDDLHV